MSVCGQISECVSEYCDSGGCVGAGVKTMVKVVPVVRVVMEVRVSSECVHNINICGAAVAAIMAIPILRAQSRASFLDLRLRRLRVTDVR